MKRIIIVAVILLLNICLQTTLLQAIQVRGVLPNTAVVIIVSYSLLRGSTEGAVVGFFSGLLYDLLFGNSFGFYACLGLVCGFLSGKAHKNFYRENYILPLAICTCAAFFYETTIYFTGFFLRGNLDLLFFIRNLILPTAVYTAIFSIPLYRILFGINEYLEEKERYRRRLF